MKKEKKLKDPETCKHKNVIPSEHCAFCNGESGWCEDCDSEVGRSSSNEKFELI